MSINKPASQDQLDVILTLAKTLAENHSRRNYPWPNPTNKRIKKLEKENAELRKRLVVTDEMVERAAQALWSTAVGEVGQGALDGARPGTRVTWDEVHPDTKESWRRDARAALNAVLGTALVTEEEV